jgi:integrase
MQNDPQAAFIESARALKARIAPPRVDPPPLPQLPSGPAAERRHRSLNTCHRSAQTERLRKAGPRASRAYVPELAARLDDDPNLVVVLAATGARFSQIQRMQVGDVQAGQSRLMVPTSRKGRGQKRATHTAVRVGDDVMEALRPVIAGRRPAEPLLERWLHRQEKSQDGKRAVWVRDTRGAWKTSAELTRPWASIIKSAALPADTVPYSLRHSSIVRGLRAALPVRLVAQLHDTSDKIIERHYAAAIVNALDDLAAAAVVPLVDAERGKVVKLRG